MEDSIVYKQWLYDDHTKIVHIINTTGQFTEKKKSAELQIKQQAIIREQL